MRLAERLTLWGPCLWLAACGLLLDAYRGVWGPGLIGGALIGFAAGYQRWRGERRDRVLRDRMTDGLEGRPVEGPWDEPDLTSRPAAGD
jgi:hypothetical protein